MSEKINPVRETDEEALALTGTLLEEAQYAALGVKEIDTDVPLVSRVAVAWSKPTGLFFCASDLSMHSQCLAKNATCSLMLGEPGKGDGLAYPRITLIGETKRMENTDENHADFRDRFLAVHPIHLDCVGK